MRYRAAETGGARMDDRPCAGADLELAKQVRDVLFESLGADAEARGDLGVRESLRDQFQDVAFPARQSRKV